jgi:hypothetical protein
MDLPRLRSARRLRSLSSRRRRNQRPWRCLEPVLYTSMPDPCRSLIRLSFTKQMTTATTNWRAAI